MRALFLCLIAAIVVLCSKASAHESRPLFIEIVAQDALVSLKAVAPASVDAENSPSARLGKPCTLVSERRRGARTFEADYRCTGFSGVSLSIDWPAFNPSLTTIVRAQLGDGETRTAILDPKETSWSLPERRSFGDVAKTYLVIGVEHIFFGVDHLLFVAGILFIAGTFRRAVITATGFSIAHSLTLALVALDVVRVSVPAVEAVIALSIVFLAAEIARGDRTTIAWRRPALIASVFGLVHGAGFAAALAEIGLPATERIAALLFFNVGVEAGQIAIVVALFTALTLLRRVGCGGAVGWNTQRPIQARLGYPLGIVAAFWFIERTAALLAA